MFVFCLSLSPSLILTYYVVHCGSYTDIVNEVLQQRNGAGNKFIELGTNENAKKNQCVFVYQQFSTKVIQTRWLA